ncbi:MAG: phosphatidate cytidylyltransferase [Burkholderiales bacterium]|nr:phosphatidate cytidylyltransferase [Burkholderiales bacterium]
MLITRLVTAAIALPMFIGGLLWLPNPYWTGILLFLLLIGAWEWTKLCGYSRTGSGLFLTAVLISAAAVFLLSHDVWVYGASVAFWMLLAPAWLKFRWRATHSLLLGLTGWIVLVPTWLALTRLQIQPLQLLSFLAIVWIADSAAYFSGKRFGRRKLAPDISPGKTWEGAIGAAVAVAVYYIVLHFALEPAVAWPGALTGVILFAMITVMSIEGDLFESWIKRQAGVKDSGTLLPGHGGVLDRIDGLTSTMPLAALAVLYAA